MTVCVNCACAMKSHHIRTGTKYMINLDKLSDYLNNVGENL